MTLARWAFRGGAARCTAHAAIAAGDLAIPIDGNSAGWPTGAGSIPFMIEIDRGIAGKLEKCLCSAFVGGVLTVTTRGYDGTTAIAHDLGASVEHCLGATVIDDLNDHVYNTGRADHTQYLTRTDHHALTATLDGSGNATITHGFGFTPTAAILTERAGTDHLQLTALAATTLTVHGTAGQAISFFAIGLP